MSRFRDHLKPLGLLHGRYTSYGACAHKIGEVSSGHFTGVGGPTVGPQKRPSMLFSHSEPFPLKRVTFINHTLTSLPPYLYPPPVYLEELGVTLVDVASPPPHLTSVNVTVNDQQGPTLLPPTKLDIFSSTLVCLNLSLLLSLL